MSRSNVHRRVSCSVLCVLMCSCTCTISPIWEMWLVDGWRGSRWCSDLMGRWLAFSVPCCYRLAMALGWCYGCTSRVILLIVAQRVLVPVGRFGVRGWFARVAQSACPTDHRGKRNRQEKIRLARWNLHSKNIRKNMSSHFFVESKPAINSLQLQ